MGLTAYGGWRGDTRPAYRYGCRLHPGYA